MTSYFKCSKLGLLVGLELHPWSCFLYHLQQRQVSVRSRYYMVTEEPRVSGQIISLFDFTSTNLIENSTK